MNTSRTRIVIIGGGAAGVLVAAQLRKRRPDARITVVDASGRPGTGAAYGTPDATHLLNVPAPRMSAWPDEPDDLVQWLEARAVETPDGFAPRAAFGRYLGEILEAADVWVESREATGLSVGAPHRVTLDDGRVLAADAVALATGRPAESIPEPIARALGPVLESTARDAVVLDPWATGALAKLTARKPERVLVVGSGLTGVDVALHLLARGIEVTLVSRHGELPRPHVLGLHPRDVPALAELSESCALESLRAALASELEAAQGAGDDWRQVIDGIRPITARLWRSLSADDQRRFLREDLRSWEVLRHRMPPRVAAGIEAGRESGRLSIVAAELAEVAHVHDRLQITLSTADGPVRRSEDALVIATGTAWDRRALHASPLWSQLLNTRVASLHGSGIGVRTDADGRLIDDAGGTVPNVVCLGAIRQGEIWETTAIPEIRQQAQHVAELLADTNPGVVVQHPAPAAQPTQRPADAAYAEGVRRLLAVQQGASRAFAAAVAEDPNHARAHAGLALIATERPDRAGGPGSVADHLARARAAAQRGSDDDKSHVEAVAAWCQDGAAAGTARLIEHLDRTPDDALALLVLAPSIAFAGAGDALPDVWGYVDRFASVHGETPWYLGLLAYGRTEQGRLHDASDLAEAALDADPSNGNGAHAFAHVYYETDAHGVGLRWLDDWIGDLGRTQRYRPHFQWHAALHELAVGDVAAAARRYAAHLAPPKSTGVRCLVDAGSLAWRARLHPDWVTPPDAIAVLDEVGELASKPRTPFIAFHALLVQAAAGDCGAMRGIDVTDATDLQRATLHCVSEGLIALVEKRPRSALEHLLEALPGLPALGGSQVQQEVVLESALAAMLQLGAPGQAARLLSRHRSEATPGIARGAVS